MLPTTVRVLVCTTRQDMRRSFDRLALVVKESLGDDPQSGALFVFVGKSATRAKVLWWDRNGYCLLYKRLHQALFDVPRPAESDAPSVHEKKRFAATGPDMAMAQAAEAFPMLRLPIPPTRGIFSAIIAIPLMVPP